MEAIIIIEKEKGQQYQCALYLPQNFVSRFDPDLNLRVAGQTLSVYWGTVAQCSTMSEVTRHIRAFRPTLEEAERIVKQWQIEVAAAVIAYGETYRKEWHILLDVEEGAAPATLPANTEDEE